MLISAPAPPCIEYVRVGALQARAAVKRECNFYMLTLAVREATLLTGESQAAFCPEGALHRLLSLAFAAILRRHWSFE